MPAQIVAVGLDDENAKTAQKTLGQNARVLTGDATVSETADRAIELAITEFGRLDGLYHVAGGSGRRAGDGPLDQVTDEGWDYTLRLNLTSQFYSNRAAVRQFLKQKSGGAILNMGSALASSPSPKYFSTFAYAAAKSAIIGMTKSAAAYYAADNIRFNVIAPGLVETPMSQRALGDPADHVVRKTQTTPRRRPNRPTDRSGRSGRLPPHRPGQIRHRPGTGNRRRLGRDRRTISGVTMQYAIGWISA